METEKEKGKVLIIDDDPVVRDVLSDILCAAGGYETCTATDGLDGIDKIRNGSFDIIFTDLKMPKLNGMDLLKETKKLSPFTPVVMVTGISSIDVAINAMKEGAKDFITKPFRIDKVTSVAERIMGEQKLMGRFCGCGDYEGSLGRLNAELFKKLQEIGVLQSISTELDGLHYNKDIYERMVEMASRLLLAREVSFGIIENGMFRIKSAIGVREGDISIENNIFEKVVKSRNYYLASFGERNPHNNIPLASAFLSIPFIINNEVFGMLNLSDKADEATFMDDEIYLALTFAKKAALRIENNALYEVFYNNLINTLKSLVISIEARDSYTKHHSERVTSYALQIADIMDLADEDKDAIRFGGYLHDIGKIGVRDTILMKPGRLTMEEMEEIKMHPIIGYNILKPLKFFQNERDIIRYHHEKFDGSGYPDGLKGEKIPTIARILTVADTYDAMTSSRPYRNKLAHNYAIKELRDCSSSQFDREIVRAFIQTDTGRGAEL
jgi:putative nucleotidyltransferase with HDIG domain